MKFKIIFFFTFLASTFFVKAQPPIGMQCPEIVLKNANDSSIALSSLKGKVIIIDFWASWCGPCRAANKTLKKLYNNYKDSGLEIYSISEDYTKNAWINGVKQDKATWIQVFDDGGTIANKWRISYLPFTFIIDKEGKIVAADVEAKDLEKLIKQLL